MSRRKKSLEALESINEYVSNCSPIKDKEVMMRYFRNKTMRYDSSGKLQRTFSVFE